MPAIRKSTEAVEGGLRGINKFLGRISDVEEDVEGKFGPQLAFHAYDVEVEESTDPIVLEDGKYTWWVKQSSKKGSVNVAMLSGWEEFCDKNGIEYDYAFEALHDKLVRFEKVEVTEANEEKNISAGMAFVPVELVEEGKTRRPTKSTKSDKGAAPKTSKPAPASKPDAGEPDEALVAAIVSAVGEDGATRDIIRREVVKKAALRTKMTEAGGLDAVLAHLVEAGTLSEDDGFYYRAEETGSEE